MGKKAAEILRKSIDKKKIEKIHRLENELIERDSVNKLEV